MLYLAVAFSYNHTPLSNSSLLTLFYFKTMNNSTTEREVLTMYYTQEQIDRANQADLVSFLQSQGEQLTRAGNEYRWKRHDSLDRKSVV